LSKKISTNLIPMCGARHDTALTQERFEAMGQQSEYCGDIGDEATTFLQHVQAKAL
jgi:hypothetical protein